MSIQEFLASEIWDLFETVHTNAKVVCVTPLRTSTDCPGTCCRCNARDTIRLETRVRYHLRDCPDKGATTYRTICQDVDACRFREAVRSPAS